MKKINLVIAGLVLITGLAASFSFTKSTPSVLVDGEELYFISDNDVIAFNDPNSIVPEELVNLDYWTTSSFSCPNGSKLCKIVFILDLVADGPADGALTYQEAINEVNAWRNQTGSLPPHGGVVRVQISPTQYADIIVYRKN